MSFAFLSTVFFVTLLILASFEVSHILPVPATPVRPVLEVYLLFSCSRYCNVAVAAFEPRIGCRLSSLGTRKNRVQAEVFLKDQVLHIERYFLVWLHFAHKSSLQNDCSFLCSLEQTLFVNTTQSIWNTVLPNTGNGQSCRDHHLVRVKCSLSKNKS